MKDYLRKTFYAADLLLCGLYILTAYYFMPLPISVRLPPYLLSYVVTLLIQLAMFYPILLRANVSLLLYKREKSATRAVLLSSVLQILGIVVGGYNYIWLSATYKFQCIYDEITGEDLYHGMTMVDYYTELLVIAAVIVWLVFIPIIACALSHNRLKESSEPIRWKDCCGGFLFTSSCGKRFMSLLALFFVACMIGLKTDNELSAIGLIVLSSVFYRLANKHYGRTATVWEYVALCFAMVLFHYAQLFTDNGRMTHYAIVTIIVLALCLFLFKKTKKVTVPVLTFFTLAFVLPILIIGYNPYAGMDCARYNNYTDAYVNRGVMFVERYDETRRRAMCGIRDRYRVVVSPD